MELLPDRLPWFIAGPLMGLVVVGMYAVANRPLGAVGAYANAVAFATRRPFQGWLLFYFVGLVGGAFLAAVLGSGLSFGLRYGELKDQVPLIALVPLLFLAGGVMGFGARLAGGCTSGHGLRGSASLSPASLAATGTFMAVAVVVTAAVHLISGGVL